jgi:hypothetical protein
MTIEFRDSKYFLGLIKRIPEATATAHGFATETRRITDEFGESVPIFSPVAPQRGVRRGGDDFGSCA